MLDCRGKEMKAGDRVAYASTKYGLTFGELLYNVDAKKAYHILKDDGAMYYPQKPWRGQKDTEILNLTAYVEDEINGRL